MQRFRVETEFELQIVNSRLFGLYKKLLRMERDNERRSLDPFIYFLAKKQFELINLAKIKLTENKNTEADELLNLADDYNALASELMISARSTDSPDDTYSNK